MPRKAASSSSSSSEEDLAAFQSVAVSFEEITSKQKEVAQKAKERIAGTSKRKRAVQKKRAHDHRQNGAAVEHDSGVEDDDGPWDQLDPIQLKVAAALDSQLEVRLRYRLKEPGPKKKRKETRAAQRAETEAAEEGVCTDGAFRFFARATPGQPPVLEPYEPPPLQGTPFPELLRRSRAPSAEEASAAIPMLAVDGDMLLASAAAAAVAATAATSSAEKGKAAGAQNVGARPQPKKKEKKDKRGGVDLGEGVVIDPRVSVPHDDRIRKLVGFGVDSGNVAQQPRLAC